MTNVFPMTVNTINILNIDARMPCSTEIGGRPLDSDDEDVSLVASTATRGLLLVLFSLPPFPLVLPSTPAINGSGEDATRIDTLASCSSCSSTDDCNPSSPAPNADLNVEERNLVSAIDCVVVKPVAAAVVGLAVLEAGAVAIAMDIPSTNWRLIGNAMAVSDKIITDHDETVGLGCLLIRALAAVDVDAGDVMISELLMPLRSRPLSVDVVRL